VSQVTALPFYLYAQYFFLEQQYGTLGIAISEFILQFITFIITYLYVRTNYETKHFFTDFNISQRIALADYLTLGYPSALMVYFDAWSNNFAVLFASYLGV
jgi:Na+-driven multidrug efflux pump